MGESINKFNTRSLGKNCLESQLYFRASAKEIGSWLRANCHVNRRAKEEIKKGERVKDSVQSHFNLSLLVERKPIGLNPSLLVLQGFSPLIANSLG